MLLRFGSDTDFSQGPQMQYKQIAEILRIPPSTVRDTVIRFF